MHPSRPGLSRHDESSATILALEPRVLLDGISFDQARPFRFQDSEGTPVVVELEGPGTGRVTLRRGGTTGSDIHQIDLTGTDGSSSLAVRPALSRSTRVAFVTGGELGGLRMDAVSVDGPGILLASLEKGTIGRFENGADLAVAAFKGAGPAVTISTIRSDERNRVGLFGGGDLGTLDLKGDVSGLQIGVLGALGSLTAPGRLERSLLAAGSFGSLRVTGPSKESEIAARSVITSVVFGSSVAALTLSAGKLGLLRFDGGASGLRLNVDGSFDSLSSRGDVKRFVAGVGGAVESIQVIAGSLLDGALQVGGRVGLIRVTREDGSGGTIRNVEASIAGDFGGVEAADVDDLRARVDGDIGAFNLAGAASTAGEAAAKRLQLVAAKTIKSIDRLRADASNTLLERVPFARATKLLESAPGAPGGGLRADDVRLVLDRAISRARSLGVNATLSVVDREGTILGAVRMTDPALTADPGTARISGGGTSGLEGVTVPSSLTATSKAGTAAFLSTSGNAFTTRTAGFIIQPNFPVGVDNQSSGPLFGVQFSQLPTSDVNRLPLGLSADPGGVPLYLDGRAVGGIGVELDGVYGIDRTGVGGDPTAEELIALAAQAGFEPPREIRADNILVGGVRLDYANSEPPPPGDLLPLPTLADLQSAGLVRTFVEPISAPASMFRSVSVGRVVGNTLAQFVNSDGSLSTRAGAAEGGESLSEGEVSGILERAQALNQRLRAAIRNDRPRVSRVTVSVVDAKGSLLGVLRSDDAPVFGLDVSVQKARSAALLSRGDAGALLAAAESGAFAFRVDAARVLGVKLDGSVALSERAIGFLSRPTLPDGIRNSLPGPFGPATASGFSVFSNGLQTELLVTNLVSFLSTFAAVGDEGQALRMFDGDMIGGGGVAAASLGLANGLQIFPGAVPLYENGVLVGAIGVSGDGVDQDDFVALAGAEGFQQLASVRRSDELELPTRPEPVRMPYVKLPRSPFGGF
ncbi:MAG: heme-binding protein [Phycisphaerae bacterium]|nr:heme-binding protein [Phycisphaerae bacterium]